MLQGEKVCLRAVEPEDLELMYLLENDTSLWQHGTTNVPYSRFALRQFIEQTGNDIFQDKQLRLTIQQRGGQAVGFLDLQNFDPLHSRAEVGIVLMAEVQGRGLARETLELLFRYAGKHLRIHLLYAYVAVENASADRLFARAGFSRVATLPGWIKKGTDYADAFLYVKQLS